MPKSQMSAILPDPHSVIALMSAFTVTLSMVMFISMIQIFFKWESSILILILLECSTISIVLMGLVEAMSTMLIVSLLVFLVSESLMLMSALLSLLTSSSSSSSILSMN